MDKIIYPITGAFVVGLVASVVAACLSVSLNEGILLASMSIGFLVGNRIKVSKLKENEK